MAELFSESYTLQPTYKDGVNANRISLEAAPGTTVQDFITVGNMADQAIKLHLYPADMVYTSDGGEVSKNPNVSQENVGKWVIIENPDITLQPHQSLVIPFHATIPPGTLLGSYKGAVVATGISGDYYQITPGVKASTRLALQTDISVTNSPASIVRPNMNGSFFLSYYFWLSLIFFIGSMTYFVYTRRRERTKLPH